MGRVIQTIKRTVLIKLLLSTSLGVAKPSLISSIPAGDEASTPYGWAEFCNRDQQRKECQPNKSERPLNVKYTPYIHSLLSKITSQVNKDITMVEDLDRYGEEDVWSYPSNGRGDCEDLTLLKRKMLIEKGIPPEALSIAVVLDKEGKGHAILIVKTDRGDFALDNLNDDVKIWSKTGYKFRKYQSWKDPNIWISAQPKGIDAIATASPKINPAIKKPPVLPYEEPAYQDGAASQ